MQSLPGRGELSHYRLVANARANEGPITIQTSTTDVPRRQTVATQVLVHHGSSDEFGVASLVLSIVGLVTAGALSPIALVLSVFTVVREPKGMAVCRVAIECYRDGILGFGLLPVHSWCADARSGATASRQRNEERGSGCGSRSASYYFAKVRKSARTYDEPADRREKPTEKPSVSLGKIDREMRDTGGCKFSTQVTNNGTKPIKKLYGSMRYEAQIGNVLVAGPIDFSSYELSNQVRQQ